MATSTDFAKRLQSRATRLQVKRTLQQCREALALHAADPTCPTEVEMDSALTALTVVEINQQSTELAIADSQALEIPGEQTEDAWEDQPLDMDIQLTGHNEQVLNVEDSPGEQSSALTTAQPSELSAPASPTAAITQDQIQAAVEQQFGKESAQVRDAIVNHVARNVFETAHDLQVALEKLRQMELDILMKLVMDHNQASQSNEQMFQTALNNFDQKRQEERQDFFNRFQAQMSQGRAAFNL